MYSHTLSVLRGRFSKISRDQHFSEILSGSAYSLIGQLISMLFALVLSIFVARAYGAAELGIVAVITAFISLVNTFSVVGTNTSILRLIPEYVTRQSVRSALVAFRKSERLVMAASIITGAVCFLASGFIAGRVFSKPHLTGLFSLAALFVLFSALSQLNTSATRGLRLARAFAFMQALPSIATFAILALLAGLLKSEHDPVYAQLVAYAVTAIVGRIIIHRAFADRVATDTREPVAIRTRAILSISFPMLMTASMQFFIGQTGVVMLGMFRSESEVGYYSVATRVALLAAFVLKAINTIAAPKFSELYHGGQLDELFKVARRCTKLVFWVTAPILVVVILVGRPFLSLIYGPAFEVAYIPLVLLAVGQFANSISGSTGYFMNMTGHQNAFRNIIMATAIGNVLMGWALIPKFGAIGAAVGAAITLIGWNAATLLYIQRKYKRSIGYLPLLRPARGRLPDAV